MDNKKNVLLVVLIVGVISMTVAFAALSTNLRINGTASVPDTRWNIHFVTPWVLDTQSTVTVGGVTHQNTAVYPSVSQLQNSLSPNITLVEGLNVSLYQPGDYVKYKFNIINEGTIDAELSSFTPTMTCTSGSGCDEVINYEVKCYDNQNLTGTELTTHSVLSKTNGTAYCYLKVEYIDKTNQNSGNATMNQTYTQSALTTSLSANWQWIQRQEQANSGNQGVQGGNNEPVVTNPYLTTFDGNYTYSDTYGSQYDELNNDWLAYLRYNGTTPETCGVFGSGQAGTVCLTSPYYNTDYSSAGSYSSDFEDCSEYDYDLDEYVGNGVFTSSNIDNSCLKGYALSKATEMLNAGAFSCDVIQSSVECHMFPDDYNNYCLIDEYNGVECEDSYPCYIYNDGSYYCGT